MNLIINGKRIRASITFCTLAPTGGRPHRSCIDHRIIRPRQPADVPRRPARPVRCQAESQQGGCAAAP